MQHYEKYNKLNDTVQQKEEVLACVAGEGAQIGGQI
jgi:hypothetical protein